MKTNVAIIIACCWVRASARRRSAASGPNRFLNCRRIDLLNPIQPNVLGMDLAQLKREFGDRLSFHGGIGIQDLLPHGTPEQVRAEVRRLIDVLGAGGGYILGPSHAIMADAPVENLVALVEAVRDQ